MDNTGKVLTPVESMARQLEEGATCEWEPMDLRQEDPKRHRMEGITTMAVNLATFAYLPLQVPQIIKNMQAKQSTDLAGLQWQGFCTGALGNLLLCTYFASKGEWAAVRVQAIGSITNYIVVVQIWHAGYCPDAPFFLFLGIILVGLVLPLFKAMRLVSNWAFNIWTELTTAIGMGTLLSVVASTVKPDNMTVFAVAGIVGAHDMVLLLLVRPAWLIACVGQLSGWLATLLFMFMPVPQIIENFADHEKAKTFAIGFAFLAATGNGLCTFRALYIKDPIWFTGAFWGTLVGGWVTALSVWAAGYLNFLLFLGFSAFLFIYLGAMLVANGWALREAPHRQVAFVFGR